MFSSFVLADMTWILDSAGWLLAAAIIVIGLFVLGWSDVVRLQPRRIWALSGACFTESIRRGVLWVTPLAIIGVIVVVQLQQPINEQDAIRQTTRYCLFCSGLLVGVTAIILACTNLPREIENRVIYTIVTKPTTRLEIVLGKVLGFARVSALILIIMGLFTYGYLELRNWRMVRHIEAELEVLPQDSAIRPTMEYYARTGLLSTRSLEQTADLGIYSRLPHDDDNLRWMNGGEGQYITVPFAFTSSQKDSLAAAMQTGAPLILKVVLKLERHEPSPEQLKEIRDMHLSLDDGSTAPVFGPQLPSTQPAEAAKPAKPVPQLTGQLLDEEERSLGDLGDSGGTKLVESKEVPGSFEAYASVKPEDVEKLLRVPKFYVEINGTTPSVEYGAGTASLSFFVPNPHDPNRPQLTFGPAAGPDGKVALPAVLAHPNRRGMQVMARADGTGSMAVYRFRHAETGNPSGGLVPFQVNIGLEKGGDFDAASENLSLISMQVENRDTGKSSGPIRINPELNRTNYVNVPVSDVAGGNFDVMVRGLTSGQILGVKPDSVALVTADRSFSINLLKSLTVLWLLSVLVVIIAVFASTFLSWPIAVVLTLLILLGHWGVDQLGDALRPGVGRSVATDFQLRDPVGSKVVSSGVDALAKLLKTVATVLPDVSKFPVIEDIERGVAIPPAKLLGALAVLLGYGLPMIVFSYIILKNKEVAP